MIDRVELNANPNEIFPEGRDRAIQRLDGILDRTDFHGDIIKNILGIYGFRDNDLYALGHAWRYKKAMELLTNDLLLENFYDSDGTPSEYALPWVKIAGGEIQAEDYVYIGMEANKFAYKFAGLGSVYEEFSRAVVIEKYVRKFKGAEDLPIIVIPGEIYINQNAGEKAVHLVYSSHFEAPYGGDNNQDITIFRHKFHRIPFKK